VPKYPEFLNLSDKMDTSGHKLDLLLKRIADGCDSVQKLTAIDSIRFDLLKF